MGGCLFTLGCRHLHYVQKYTRGSQYVHRVFKGTWPQCVRHALAFNAGELQRIANAAGLDAPQRSLVAQTRGHGDWYRYTDDQRWPFFLSWQTLLKY